MLVKPTCETCSKWDKNRAISYDGKKIAICFLLSGKHLPGNANTFLYSTHYRGSNGPSQNLVTRQDFCCNQRVES